MEALKFKVLLGTRTTIIHQMPKFDPHSHNRHDGTSGGLSSQHREAVSRLCL